MLDMIAKACNCINYACPTSALPAEEREDFLPPNLFALHTNEEASKVGALVRNESELSFFKAVTRRLSNDKSIDELKEDPATGAVDVPATPETATAVDSV